MAVGRIVPVSHQSNGTTVRTVMAVWDTHAQHTYLILVHWNWIMSTVTDATTGLTTFRPCARSVIHTKGTETMIFADADPKKRRLRH